MGIGQYLEKPVSINDMLAALDGVLSKLQIKTISTMQLRTKLNYHSPQNLFEATQMSANNPAETDE